MKDSVILARHILDAISKIEAYTKDVDKNSFEGNFMIQDAVIRNIEIIGEASGKLSSDFKNKFSEIAWRKIIGMRNKLIHNYFSVDIETVWNVVELELPALKEALLQGLKSDGDGK